MDPDEFCSLIGLQYLMLDSYLVDLMELTFQVPVLGSEATSGASMTTHELLPGGSKISVTYVWVRFFFSLPHSWFQDGSFFFRYDYVPVLSMWIKTLFIALSPPVFFVCLDWMRQIRKLFSFSNTCSSLLHALSGCSGLFLATLFPLLFLPFLHDFWFGLC